MQAARAKTSRAAQIFFMIKRLRKRYKYVARAEMNGREGRAQDSREEWSRQFLNVYPARNPGQKSYLRASVYKALPGAYGLRKRKLSYDLSK